MALSSERVPVEERLRRLDALVDREVAGPHELEALLRQIYHTLFDVEFDPAERGRLKETAPALIAALFSARMRLRDRIADWHERGFLARPAEAALRDCFRILRYGVDMLGELQIGHQQLGENETARRAFTGQDFNTQVHAAFANGRNIPFRSGDVLVVRGHAHNSAAIARIGDVDTVFSHTALIHIAADGTHHVVEALIEDGSVVKPLDELLGHHVGRAVLFRCKDAKLAARAAELAYERIKASQDGSQPHIPYDFSMRLKGRSKLFCAKLVHQAYLDASRGAVDLPAYKTRFDVRNPDFFRRIGVKARETYAPGDLDLDPRFDLVAEWQDYRTTSHLRRQDMAMTKFFEWMEKDGYTFQPDWLVRLVAIFGQLSSLFSERVKTLISSVIPKVPRKMPRKTIAAIAMLHKTAEAVMPALYELDQNHIRMTGLPIHPRELLAHLERLRDVSGGRIGYLTAPRT